jgi:hypothetical protein
MVVELFDAVARFIDVDCFYKSWRFAVFGGRV